MDALGDDDKVQVAPFADEAPRVLAPFICLLNKKVGGHAGVNQAAWYRVASVAFALDRLVEVRGFGDDGAVLVVHRVAAEHIAVQTALADFVAPVPRIPYAHFTFLVRGIRPKTVYL